MPVVSILHSVSQCLQHFIQEGDFFHSKLFAVLSLSMFNDLLKNEKAVRMNVYVHSSSMHAMTAVFCSESDPVNSSANFSIYPWLCVYKSALSHPIHQFLAFYLCKIPLSFIIFSLFQILLETRAPPFAPWLTALRNKKWFLCESVEGISWFFWLVPF